MKAKAQAFTAHGFDKNAELQFTAAGDLAYASRLAVSVTRMATLIRFSKRARADDAALHLITGAASKRPGR